MLLKRGYAEVVSTTKEVDNGKKGYVPHQPVSVKEPRQTNSQGRKDGAYPQKMFILKTLRT